MFWHRRTKGFDRRTARELVQEAEAIVTGDLTDVLASGRVLLPPWAWVNKLAHGSVTDLQREFDGRRVTDHVTWRDARSLLAGEVLAASISRGPLLRVQREVLIPLELELANGARRPVSPQDLIRRVVTALADDARQTHPGDTPRRP